MFGFRFVPHFCLSPRCMGRCRGRWGVAPVLHMFGIKVNVDTWVCGRFRKPRGLMWVGWWCATIVPLRSQRAAGVTVTVDESVADSSLSFMAARMRSGICYEHSTSHPCPSGNGIHGFVLYVQSVNHNSKTKIGNWPHNIRVFTKDPLLSDTILLDLSNPCI